MCTSPTTCDSTVDLWNYWKRERNEKVGHPHQLKRFMDFVRGRSVVLPRWTWEVTILELLGLDEGMLTDKAVAKQKVTKAGRAFFANSRMNVEVIVPLKARLRQNGREFEIQMSFDEAVDQRGEVRALRSQTPAQRQITT